MFVRGGFVVILRLWLWHAWVIATWDTDGKLLARRLNVTSIFTIGRQTRLIFARLLCAPVVQRRLAKSRLDFTPSAKVKGSAVMGWANSGMCIQIGPNILIYTQKVCL